MKEQIEATARRLGWRHASHRIGHNNDAVRAAPARARVIRRPPPSRISR